MNAEAEPTAWAAFIRRTKWLCPMQGALRLGSFTQDDAGFGFAGMRFTQAALESAMPQYLRDFDQIERFNLLHEGWRIASFAKFRPLAYICAFGPDIVLEAAWLTVASLLARGQWAHEVLIMTGPASVTTLQTMLAPFNLGARLTILGIEPANDLLDWCLARYRLAAHPLFCNCRPLLYLDADIICDAPLDRLAVQLQSSPQIHAKREGRLGEGSRQSDGRWFGWRLLEADGVPFDPQAPGFSTGALGAASAATARPAYDLILSAAYARAAQTGQREPPYDQAMAGYVLRKLGLVNLELMEHYLALNRVDGPEPDDPTAKPPLGLKHFTGGDFPAKFAAMSAYAAHLGIPNRT
jgi:hypothetical protein